MLDGNAATWGIQMLFISSMQAYDHPLTDAIVQMQSLMLTASKHSGHNPQGSGTDLLESSDISMQMGEALEGIPFMPMQGGLM